MEPMMEATERTIAFPMEPRSITMSTFMPASNRIMLSAMMLMRGASSLKRSLST